MPAINYNKINAPKVKAGTKRFTIRGIRKRPIKKDDYLVHYTGLRTKEVEKLLEGHCTILLPLRMTKLSVKVAGETISREGIAKLDGFDSWAKMKAFFEKTHGLPFEGVLIGW